MQNQKTVKRFVVGFYSGESYDIVGHGKTLKEALENLRLRNMAKAAKFLAEDSFKKYGFVDIRDYMLREIAIGFGEQYEQNCRFFCNEVVEHYYDYANQLFEEVSCKEIKLKYPLCWL